jgi:hypothetical protein
MQPETVEQLKQMIRDKLDLECASFLLNEQLNTVERVARTLGWREDDFTNQRA